MMKLSRTILGFLFLIAGLHSHCQTADWKKVNEAFIKYLSTKLTLNAQETSSIEPLVKKYLAEKRVIAKSFNDPLEREQQIVTVKIKYRKLFTPLIGEIKAGMFFQCEQAFRREIRNELKQRNTMPKVN